MPINSKAVRPYRKMLAQHVRNGHKPLRVVGDQINGYRLGVETETNIVLIGPMFKKQGEAKTYGLVKFRKLAKAVLARKAA